MGMGKKFVCPIKGSSWRAGRSREAFRCAWILEIHWNVPVLRKIIDNGDNTKTVDLAGRKLHIVADCNLFGRKNGIVAAFIRLSRRCCCRRNMKQTTFKTSVLCRKGERKIKLRKRPQKRCTECWFFNRVCLARIVNCELWIYSSVGSVHHERRGKRPVGLFWAFLGHFWAFFLPVCGTWTF